MTRKQADEMVGELIEASRDMALKGSMPPEMHGMIEHRFEVARRVVLDALTAKAGR